MNYEKFHVLTVISNPVYYKSRYKNYKIFEESITRKGAHFWTVELQTGARKQAITSDTNPRHIQIWQTGTKGELWHKEQLINIGIQEIIRRAPDCRYIMWSDSDLLFEADMLEKTIQALQHWPIVQAWSHLISLDATGHVINMFKSFMYCRITGDVASSPGYPPRIGSPGGAWAFRREVLNEIGSALSGPIIDFGIVGSGDVYFANAIMGEIEKSCRKPFHPNYTKWLRLYADQADSVVKRNVGYVSNTVRHLFHGSHSSRGYEWRDNILIDNQFNPETDLRRDVSGLWTLVGHSPRQIKLRDEIRSYFRSRSEDTLAT